MRTRVGFAALAAALAFLSTGCGTPGAPQPPSLHLPDKVSDLAAVRTGNQVALTWAMPKRNTDRLALKGAITVRLCRKEGAGVCEAVSGEMQLAPGAAGSLTDPLPPQLAAGEPRALSYFVELENRSGRSAGLSNAAAVVAGMAPAPLTGLRAEARKVGVALHWTPAPGEGPAVAVRLHRKLLNAPEAKPKQGLLAPESEPAERSLLVEAGHGGRALDSDARVGQTYEYRAQRVARVTVDGQTVELAGELSTPVRIELRDVFPPAAPLGLAAVATTGEGGAAAIDLSWQPDTEPDLAGYAVYRREGDGGWQRISPAEPVTAPAFHDANVQAGHTYRYSVSAVDQGGHESARSAETEEVVPTP